MTKVYVVYTNGYEGCPFCDKSHYVDALDGVFDSEEKAINYILDQIKKDHEYIKRLRLDRKDDIPYHAIAVDKDLIWEGAKIYSSFYVNNGKYDETYYTYKSYDVK